MSERKLTTKERMVFYYLVKYPNESDRFVSEKSGIKLSTVTAIKNRLLQLGYFRSIRIPCYYNIGYEMFNYSIWKLLSNKLDFEGIVESDSFKQLNYMMGQSGTRLFMVNFSRDYTDTWRAINAVNKYIRDSYGFEYTDKLAGFNLFPLRESIILSYMDYDSLVGKALDIGQVKPIDPYIARSVYQFNKIEEKVFRALIEYPDVPDTTLSEKFGMTRQLISRLKKKFDKEKLFKTIRMPNLNKLGFSIMEFTTIPIRDDWDKKDILPVIKRELPKLRPIIALMSDTRLFYYTAYFDFPDYQSSTEAFLMALSDARALGGEPNTKLLSIKGLEIMHKNITNMNILKGELPSQIKDRSTIYK